MLSTGLLRFKYETKLRMGLILHHAINFSLATKDMQPLIADRYVKEFCWSVK